MPTRPPLHRPPGYRRSPNKRPEASDPFYGSAPWKRLREACLRRDGYQCTELGCQTPGRGRGGRLIAGHIIPRTKGGADVLHNLKTVCPDCDNRWHVEKGGDPFGR